MGKITRIFEADMAHRVMHEGLKCFNLHGHRLKIEATFDFVQGEGQDATLGYAVDFKELKRVVGTFLDEFIDHACLLNPEDRELISLCKENGWRLWVMGLGKVGDINPSAENIAEELAFIINTFFNKEENGIWLTNLRLYETPNCFVDVEVPTLNVSTEVVNNFKLWRQELGDVLYDSRLKEK